MNSSLTVRKPNLKNNQLGCKFILYQWWCAQLPSWGIFLFYSQTANVEYQRKKTDIAWTILQRHCTYWQSIFFFRNSENVLSVLVTILHDKASCFKVLQTQELFQNYNIDLFKLSKFLGSFSDLNMYENIVSILKVKMKNEQWVMMVYQVSRQLVKKRGDQCSEELSLILSLFYNRWIILQECRQWNRQIEATQNIKYTERHRKMIQNRYLFYCPYISILIYVVEEQGALILKYPVICVYFPPIHFNPIADQLSPSFLTHQCFLSDKVVTLQWVYNITWCYQQKCET